MPENGSESRVSRGGSHESCTPELWQAQKGAWAPFTLRYASRLSDHYRAVKFLLGVRLAMRLDS